MPVTNPIHGRTLPSYHGLDHCCGCTFVTNTHLHLSRLSLLPAYHCSNMTQRSHCCYESEGHHGFSKLDYLSMILRPTLHEGHTTKQQVSFYLCKIILIILLDSYLSIIIAKIHLKILNKCYCLIF